MSVFLYDSYHLVIKYTILTTNVLSHIISDLICAFPEAHLDIKKFKFLVVLLFIIKTIKVSRNLDIRLQHQGLLVWFQGMFVYKMKIYGSSWSIVPWLSNSPLPILKINKTVEPKCLHLLLAKKKKRSEKNGIFKYKTIEMSEIFWKKQNRRLWILEKY